MMEKHRLKALGLMLLAALCLSALVASGASANWRVLGVETAANKEVTVSTHQNTVLLVPGLNLAITCTTLAGNGTNPVKLLAKSSEAVGQIDFSGCTTAVKGVFQPTCNPINQPIEAGFKAHLVLIGTKNLVLFEPVLGSTILAPIEFNEAKCALVQTTDVTGRLLAECLTPALAASDCSTEETSHLLKQQTNASDVLKFGTREASLDGVAKTSLTTEPTEKWSGIV